MVVKSYHYGEVMRGNFFGVLFGKTRAVHTPRQLILAILAYRVAKSAEAGDADLVRISQKEIRDSASKLRDEYHDFVKGMRDNKKDRVWIGLNEYRSLKIYGDALKSDKIVLNTLKKMESKGELGVWRKSRKRCWYSLHRIIRFEIRRLVINEVYGRKAENINKKLTGAEKELTDYLMSLRKKYISQGEEETLKAEITATFNERKNLQNRDEWNKAQRRYIELVQSTHRKIEERATASEVKELRGLAERAQKLHEQYEKVMKNFNRISMDDTTQYEKEQERKEAWEHEMNSIASRIKNTEVGASVYHASSRLFGVGKDVPDIVRHHLDWIQYHTRKIAEEIEKSGGNKTNLLLVTRPDLFIANEEPDAEIRDMFITPSSAGWESPPLPLIILNRLKKQSETFK